jgi:DNA invertase Pin-like site-specific DNA recombinase
MLRAPHQGLAIAILAHSLCNKECCRACRFVDPAGEVNVAHAIDAEISIRGILQHKWLICSQRGPGRHNLEIRPVLAAALRACRPEDVLVIWKLDRLGRNTKHLLEIVEDLTQRGVGLKTLTGYTIDTTTPHGKLMLHMFAALAEYERALIQERVMAGIVAARARGRKGGRRPKLSPEQQELAQQLAQGGRPITKIAQTLGCSRHTVYKALSATQPQHAQQDQAAAAD